MGNKIIFKSIQVNSSTPVWCVDGRAPIEAVEKGPQMLGGSLHMAVLQAIATGKALDESIIVNVFSSLKEKGYGLGVHTDTHAKEGTVGCGFAQNLKAVFIKAVDQKGEIQKRLLQILNANKEKLGEMDFAGIIESAYEKLTAYSLDNLMLTGEALVAAAEKSGAKKIVLDGSHQEQVVFVNLKENTSYDTTAQVKAGRQAFNLDLWAVTQQAEALGIDRNFAIGTSLILYQAAEMIIVEDQGKPQLIPQVHV
jgi:hypothetical protein